MKALLFMGCPQMPVQTPAVLDIASKLKLEGIEVTAAGNKAALSLVRGCDPEKHYVTKMTDIDRCIADIAEHKTDYDLCFVFIHNDSGIVYLETLRSLSKAKTVAVIFGKNIEPLVNACRDSVVVAARASHNFTPLRAKIREVGLWAALTK
ncbi:MAG: DUF1890 family protein [Candidatus Methanoperedens sp.]